MLSFNNDWDVLLADEFKKEYYLKIREFLKREYSTKIVYPDKFNIYEALKLTSYENTKVVILGQDPYHGENQAHGLAFSVQKNVEIPPSLLNMYKELKEDIGCFIPDNGYLADWAKQGVLLLNTSLTVVANLANSHSNIGWQILTDKIISLLNEKETPVVFMLWGNNAKQKTELITHKKQLILTAAHPSPLSAHRGFFGCKHFSKANAFLKENGLKEIDWQIKNNGRMQNNDGVYNGIYLY